jgi:hypothetical protein
MLCTSKKEVHYCPSYNRGVGVRIVGLGLGLANRKKHEWSGQVSEAVQKDCCTGVEGCCPAVTK